MNSLITTITEHAHTAHWYVFVAILLAGLNIPICIDLLLLISAFLATMIIPEHTVYLFLSCLFGCYFSAWLAYWLGRILAPRLCSIRWLKHIVNIERLQRMKTFYEKYGLRTFIIGRFIPFGVRNCLFMSSGMSKMHFGKFALLDACACTLWCTTLFALFYYLGQNYQILWHYLKAFNLFVFVAFGVTVIGYVWYKIRKKAHA
jgi:membrane-associated protein